MPIHEKTNRAAEPQAPIGNTLMDDLSYKDSSKFAAALSPAAEHPADAPADEQVPAEQPAEAEQVTEATADEQTTEQPAEAKLATTATAAEQATEVNQAAASAGQAAAATVQATTEEYDDDLPAAINPSIYFLGLWIWQVLLEGPFSHVRIHSFFYYVLAVITAVISVYAMYASVQSVKVVKRYIVDAIFAWLIGLPTLYVGVGSLLDICIL